MTRPAPRPPAARRGAILIVVLALLALFAVIGLSFVYYADSEATSARLYRESQGQGGATAGTATIATPPSGQPHANKFLATLMFGVEEVSPVTTSPNNVPQQNPFLNALRGHELARAVWGWSNQWNDPALGASSTQPFHVIPFNGVGTFHQDLDLSDGTGGGLGDYRLGTVKRGQVINYTLTKFDFNLGTPGGGRALLFDPEYTDIRGLTGGNNPGTQPTPFSQVNATNGNPSPKINPRRAFIPKNAGYTYPDLNNLYLASISPTTGEVLVPSFHRNWLFNGSHNVPSGPTAVNAVNPNPMFRLAPWDPNDASPTSQTQLARNLDWVIGSGKLRALRPRPVDQLDKSELQSLGIAQYPPPETLSAAQQTNLYKYLRDKIAAGDLFPYPVLNPDGTFTGDVQNLRGGVGPQRADSLWLDIGLPTQTFMGRTIKPLVAALVVDLDGRVNINAHGNLVGSTSHVSHGGFSPAEVNLGRVLNDTDAAGLVEQRGAKTPQSQTGGANRAFVPQQTVGTNPSRPYSSSWLPTPDYLPVNWRGTNDTSVAFAAQTDAAVGTQYPQFLGLPTFGTGYRGTSSNNTNTADALNHPTLYNPADLSFSTSPGKIWDPATRGQDLMRLNLRYADLINETYDLMESGLRTKAPTTLRGQPPSPKSFARSADLAHPLRMKVTTLSAGLDVPALAPTFYQIGGSSTGNPVTVAASAKPLEYDAATGNLIFPDPAGTATGVSKPPAFAYPPDSAVAGPNAAANPKQYLPPSDFGETTLVWGNVRAALGPVDLNRPLTDYRAFASITPTPQALAPTSVAGTQHLTAWADRHNLARDIFARLVLATGAAAVVDPKTGDVTVGLVDTNPGPTRGQILPLDPNNATDAPRFEALRYLAQLAVNIVDYVDNDDVATAFVWNPVNVMTGNGPPMPVVNAPFPLTRVAGNARPAGAAGAGISNNELLSDLYAQNFDAANLRNCVVFGAEKPRLVLNEAYAEAINETDPAVDPDIDPAASAVTAKFPKKPAHVRFWLELTNPTKTPYSGSTTGAIKGDVYLHYDSTDVMGAKFPDTTDYTPYSPYRIEIVRDWKKDATKSDKPEAENVKNGVRSTGNPTGDLVPGTAAGALTAAAANIQPDCRMDFDTILAAGSPQNAKRIVAPNAGAYKAVTGNSSGFVVLAPKNTMFPNYTSTIVFNPTAGWTAADVIDVSDIDTSKGAGETQPTTGYLWELPDQDGLDVSKNPGMGKIHPVKEMRQHVIALRRLVNPYLPPNDPGSASYRDTMPANPYVTVDVMADVPAFDAIIRAKDTPHDMLRQPKTDTSAVGFDPFPPPGAKPPPLSGWERYAVGRVQPLAGQSAITPIEITGMGATKVEVFPGLHQTNGNVKGSFQDSASASPFPTTCLVPQRPTTTPAPAETPWHTFGRHNGRDDSAPASWTANDFVPTVDATQKTAETLMAPFTWLPHADRPLVNSLELLHVSGRPAHELTRLLLQPPSAVGGTGSTPAYYQYLAPWLERPTSLPTGVAKTNNANGLYRALDLLRVRPWVAGVPMGGKIHGRVNINTIQDDDVAKALFDAGSTTAKTGSQFDPDEVVDSTATTVATAKGVWDNLAKSRTYSRGAAATPAPTPSPSGSKNTAYPPGPTADDDPTATNVDRPFYALGSGLWSPQTAGIGNRVTVRARGLDDTILRRTNSTFTSGVPSGGDDPMLWLPDNATRANIDLPYTRSEAARKVFNNATTVSNGFAVWFTIGYFEVRKNGSALRTVDEGNGVSRPLLGKEAYKDYPGDLRQQYFAIVDRSNLTLGDAAGNAYIPGSGGVAPQLGPRPAFTAVEGTFAAGATKINILATTPSGANPATATTTIYADGQAVQISNGGRLFVGVGATAEVVTVTGVEPLKNPPGPMGTTIPGVAVLTVQGSGGAGTGTVHPHATGERVCNALPGNPGPLNQTQLATFDVFPPTGSGTPSKYTTVVPYIVQTRGP